jgi:hypothetical protein
LDGWIEAFDLYTSHHAFTNNADGLHRRLSTVLAISKPNNHIACSSVDLRHQLDLLLLLSFILLMDTQSVYPDQTGRAVLSKPEKRLGEVTRYGDAAVAHAKRVLLAVATPCI